MGNRLEVKVDGNASGFKHTMDTVRTQAKGAMDSIAHSWSAPGLLTSLGAGLAGALSFEGVKSALEGFISRASSIREVSEQLEMATDQTQKWEKAANKLGLTFGGMQNVIMSILSKRQEALHDVKAADLFTMLGISRENVLHQDASEFVKSVLLAGDQGRESRAILEDIVSRRGLKYIPAAKIYDQQRPNLDPETIEEAHKAEMAKQKVGDAIDTVIGQAAEIIADKRERKGFFAFVDYLHNPLNWFRKGAFSHDTLHKVIRIAMGQEEGTPNASAPGPDGFIHHFRRGFGSTPTTLPDDDPLVGVREQQQKEFQLRREEGEFALHEAQRRNMTIAERKKSIAGDLSVINAEISARDKAQKAGLIFGMTKTQQDQMLPSDVKKQLQDDLMSLLGLRTHAAGLTNELRQDTNFRFDADSLARVGLYSAATVNINPMVAIGREQLNVLHQIERNTSQNKNPHQR